MVWYDSEQKKILQEADTSEDFSRKEQLAELQQRQGTAWEARLTRAQMASDKFGEKVPGFKEWVTASGVANNPKFVEFLMEVGEASFREDDVRAENPGSMGMTTNDAQQKIQQVLGDKEHPYHIKRHPGHGAAVTEMQQLFNVAYTV